MCGRRGRLSQLVPLEARLGEIAIHLHVFGACRQMPLCQPKGSSRKYYCVCSIYLCLVVAVGFVLLHRPSNYMNKCFPPGLPSRQLLNWKGSGVAIRFIHTSTRLMHTKVRNPAPCSYLVWPYR